MKNSDYEQTSEALFLWFQQMRGKGSLSGVMLQAKALEFFNRFQDGEETFTASIGWLERWKKRHGVRQLNISGEVLSANSSAVDSFVRKLDGIIQEAQLSSQQIYTCDEAGLNFKMLPSKTLAAKQKQSAPGYKRSKEQVTVLLCAKQSGDHKLKLLLIGKAKKLNL